MTPRLLDFDATRQYLGNVSKSLLREYVKNKVLRPVPMPNAANLYGRTEAHGRT